MANTARTKPGEPNTTASINEGPNPLEKIAVSYESNKKRINTILVAVVAVVVGVFAYFKLYKAPQEEKASIAMIRAQQLFAIDSFSLALNGDGQGIGFLKIMKKYSGTSAENLCHYYAGVCYLKTGDYNNAIKQLEAFNGKGTVLQQAAEGLLGDAYMETGNAKKAIDQYNKVVANKDDNAFTPMYLQRLGMAYEKNNQVEEAKKAYHRLKDEYPRSFQARDVDKVLAALGDLN